ncbi:MAG TPA: M20 family peptidase, partial [Anaerolineaceae bacterium]|nr:M20 family peptidase [Anaerolineaceae bacterium]
METLIIVVVFLLFLAAFMLIRTARVMKPLPPVESGDLVEVDAQKVAERLSAVIQLETISNEQGELDLKTFKQLHKKLEEMFPLVHKHMKREIISDASLLFTWEGKDKQSNPVLFAAHQDVVPADPTTLDQWTHPPFSGKIADGFIWGRGTIDIKSQMMAALESAELLLGEGFEPERTIYLAFGQDEEIGGQKGAAKIVEYLKENNVQLAAMMDEGGTILEGAVSGVDGPIALIGTAEKGHLSLKLKAYGSPGHSSMPGKDMAIGRLSRALAKLDAHPQPIRMKALKDLFRNLGSAASFGMQFVLSNLWFFGPIVKMQAESSNTTNAMIRTSTAMTIINGGIKENVLPASAEAIVNFRLLPGDSIATVCERVRKIVKDDKIEFEPVSDGAWEASPVSRSDSKSYLILKHTIRRVFDGVPVAPSLVMGATDARYYAGITDAAYRFTPFHLMAEDLNRMHGIDERISVESYGKMVSFFH